MCVLTSSLRKQVERQRSTRTEDAAAVHQIHQSTPVKRFGYIDTVLTVDEVLIQSEYDDLFVKTSIPGHYIICFPCIVVVTYVNIHSSCLIMTLSCLKSPLLCALYTNLSHLTTNLFLFLYVLFCVFSVCYDVLLSHLNKDYLLTYLHKLKAVYI